MAVSTGLNGDGKPVQSLQLMQASTKRLFLYIYVVKKGGDKVKKFEEGCECENGMFFGVN